MKITYIHWSMTIIEMNDFTIVTDPVFKMFGFWASSHKYAIEQLPQPDLVLVSHRHVDHWDRSAMGHKSLAREIPLVVRPDRIARDARRLGYTDVRELPAGQKTEVKGLTINAVQARHSGGEVGFVLEGEKTIYFAGDTGFDEGIFTTIGQRFNLDVALLPIGGLRVLGLLNQMGPHQAVKAIKLLQPKVVVGIHWDKHLHRPPLIQMPGTPKELAIQLAELNMDVTVHGRAPLETVELL